MSTPTETFRAARDFLVAELRTIPGVEVASPSGTMYAFLRIRGVDDSAVERRTAARSISRDETFATDLDNDELLRAITAAARGEALLDPATTARLLARVRETERRSDQDAFRDLTDRELDVLAQVARGKTNAEIAEALNLSEKTARNYVSAILEKLQLSNRIELATYAVEHHLFDRLGRE